MAQRIDADRVLEKDRLAKLQKDLHEWVVQLTTATERSAQRAAYLQVGLIGREIKSLQDRWDAAVAESVDLRGCTDDVERVARLVSAFELCAQLHMIVYEMMSYIDASNRFITRMNEIAAALDVIPPGRRSALAPLLDHGEPVVQAMAGCRLVKLLPERVIPLLRRIRTEIDGLNSSAWSQVYWTLHDYDTEQQKQG